jgi:anti-anti-sigma factor
LAAPVRHPAAILAELFPLKKAMRSAGQQSARSRSEEETMDMIVTQAQGRVPVTILHLAGRIDASNYQTVADKAKELYEAGTRDLLLDLSDVSFISSAGIVALHRTALLFRGEKVEEEEEESGWNAIHAIDRDQAGGAQEHVKLFNPRPDVDHARPGGLQTLL